MASGFTLNFSKKKHADIFSQVKKLPKLAVKYGFIGDKVAPYPDGQNVIDVAIWNEYGTDRIPARPFFRTSWERNKKAYKKDLVDFYRNILNGKVQDAEVFFDILGAKASNRLKMDIVAFSDPPNAPSTIARKKSSNPLIDTGRLKASVSWEVYNT